MTSPVLAALLAIGATLYVFFSPRRRMDFSVVVSCITLGYISGNGDTTVGGWIATVVSAFLGFIDNIAGFF